MTYNAERFVTWDEIQSGCLELARKILTRDQTFNKILVITRGGLFPAGILARELEIREIETICVDTYDAQNRKTPTLLKAPAADFRQNVLIIDDLVDSGATLGLVKNMITDSLVVTLFAKPEGEPLVDLFHERVAQNIWVRFPWDTEPDAGAGRRFRTPLAPSSKNSA